MLLHLLIMMLIKICHTNHLANNHHLHTAIHHKLHTVNHHKLHMDKIHTHNKLHTKHQCHAHQVNSQINIVQCVSMQLGNQICTDHHICHHHHLSTHKALHHHLSTHKALHHHKALPINGVQVFHNLQLKINITVLILISQLFLAQFHHNKYKDNKAFPWISK